MLSCWRSLWLKVFLWKTTVAMTIQPLIFNYSSTFQRKEKITCTLWIPKLEMYSSQQHADKAFHTMWTIQRSRNIKYKHLKIKPNLKKRSTYIHNDIDRYNWRLSVKYTLLEPITAIQQEEEEQRRAGKVSEGRRRRLTFMKFLFCRVNGGKAISFRPFNHVMTGLGPVSVRECVWTVAPLIKARAALIGWRDRPLHRPLVVLPACARAGSGPFVKVLSDSRGIGSISHRVWERRLTSSMGIFQN